MTVDIGFAVPGPLTRVSGGYDYAREILARLAQGSPRLSLLALPEGFPTPSDAAIEETGRRLRAWRGPLLIDGLAYGAFPPALSAEIGPRAVALVHHPLGLETGLDPARAAALLESERAALAAARGVICTSPDTRRRLESDLGVDPARVCVAPPGVVRPDAFAPRKGAPPVLLAVGAVTPRKNFTALVQALAGLRATPWKARIVGPTDADPAATAALERAIAQEGLADRITLTGAVAEDALAREFAGADLFVSAALYEGYGMALARAVAHGLPIVAVAGGAVAETAPRAALVAVEPVGTLTVRFADRLRALLDAPRQLDRLAAGSREMAAALPNWDATAETIRRHLGETFEERAP